MPVNRGSLHKLVAIAEATYGVTPATPVMVEIPIVSLAKTPSQRVMMSDQLRSHPYVDRMLSAGLAYDISLVTEMQPDTHDLLYKTMFGSTIASKTMKFADALSSLTMESQAGGGSGSNLFDSFTGVYFNKVDVAVSASDTKPIRATFSGSAIAGSLEATTTIASSVTAATAVDPFVFADASVAITASQRPVTSMSFSIARTVNPLNVLGSRIARQMVPDAVAITGSITIPYEDGLEAPRLTGFGDYTINLKCQSVDGSKFRKFQFNACKITRIGKPIEGRGGVMQSLDFTAYYDTSSATGVIFTTE